MTAIYLERYLNFGLTLDELRAGKPIIGIAQTGSDYRRATGIIWSLRIACAKHPRKWAASRSNFRRTRFRKPASARRAALDRNLAYLGLVEVLYGYPLDGVVLTTGCDKTTPACIMAAATVICPPSFSPAVRC